MSLRPRVPIPQSIVIVMREFWPVNSIMEGGPYMGRKGPDGMRSALTVCRQAFRREFVCGTDRLTHTGARGEGPLA